MYKVLLVDDEINILEGIATMVNWEGCGTELFVKANNGQLAFDLIMKAPPDIVITDIKMPGINGVDLIQKVHKIFPEIKFIVLSGYDEFEFAKTAMECNVKHYLLKPSNEKKIEAALTQIVDDLNEKQEKDHFIENMHVQLQKVMPIAKEQFLKDYITSKKYGREDWEYYSKLFNIDHSSGNFRLILLSIDDAHDYEHRIALKEVAADELSENKQISLSTITGEKVVFLMEEQNVTEIIERLKNAKRKFSSFYYLTFTSAVSNQGTIRELKTLYSEALNCLTQRFYLEAGSIITTNDLRNDEKSFQKLQYDHEDLIFMIRSGNSKEVRQYLQAFVEQVIENQYDVNLVKSHCIELFMLMIRQAPKENMDSYLEEIIILKDLESFEDIRKFIERVSTEISEAYYERTKKSQSNILHRIVQYVDEHIADQDLSLTKVANEILFMNSDYVGKLFKKEKGERFSNYLIDQRIKKAIEMLEQSDEVRVFELAEAVGFGNNPRYFGQVFKKHTGVTPSEYKNKD
ncbi:response regulator [Jeotgalibacillus sp. S-D1]|uniref:response regulator n=1 Tax=Jeotgalibacillus sp. S-D1 TaxID=2552189 RepID=UPI0010599641|nr:response regulator [Jeotgalibacillus sp. S-D1]TDL34256.1 response regulator [Jeotgalibacillus sp. S-D1]